MKVLHICLGGPYTEGLSYQENVLSKYHKRLGLETSIVANNTCWDNNGKIMKVKERFYTNDLGIDVYRIPLYNDNFFFQKVGFYSGLKGIIDKESPDVIFLHGCQYMDCLKVIDYKKRNPKVRIYVDNHCDVSNSARNWFSKNILHKVLWKYCAKKLLLHVECFYGVLPSRMTFMKDMYKIPEKKIKFLSFGVDDELAELVIENMNRKKFRESNLINDNDFLIVTGGKINSFKWQTLLLMKAINRIKKNVKLIIFGTVDESLEKDFFNELDAENMQYIGWIEKKSIYQYLYSADLVVFPGYHSVMWEESVGLGIPSIFKYIKETTHVDLGGNCKFIYRDSVEEIEFVLRDILENENVYCTMKKVAKEKGIVFFSYKNIAKKSIDMH